MGDGEDRRLGEDGGRKYEACSLHYALQQGARLPVTAVQMRSCQSPCNSCTSANNRAPVAGGSV